MGLFKYIFRRIQRITFSVYTVVLFSLLGINFSACVSDNGTSSKELSANSPSPEFLYNYQLLYYLYYDKDKYLDKPQSYIDKIDHTIMFKKGIPWDYHDIYYMYAQMNDPFTYYIDPLHSFDLLKEKESSEQKLGAGFSIDSSLIPQKYVINQVFENSPADKSGIKVNDEIIEIEGTPLTSYLVFERLSVASENETITYTIKRDTTTLTIPVTIESYLKPTVDLSFKDSIPFIKIYSFKQITSNDSGTYGEFIRHLRKTEKFKATVIDLRDNGGGDAEQCIAMTSEFLSKNDTIIGIIQAKIDSIHQKQYFDTTFFINELDGLAKDRYFVFLANKGTASCSEVMLAGTTNQKKFPVIGTTTYGKGIGQEILITPSFSMASITFSKVLDKNRQTYHKYGIEPDFSLLNDDAILEKAVALAKDMNYVRMAGYGTVNTGVFAKESAEQDTMPGFYFFPKSKSFLGKNFLH